MAVTNRDLEIRAGGSVDFAVNVLGGPTSLDGYSGSMQIRELRDDAVPLATVDPAGITVNAGTRQVRVRIPSADTASYAWSRGVYDLKLSGPEGDWILVQGRIVNLAAITRS